MEKGLIILAVTAIAVLLLNTLFLRIFKLPKHKRERVRKILWFVYSLFFIAIGIIFLTSGESALSGYLYIIVGLGYLVVNWLERPNKPL